MSGNYRVEIATTGRAGCQATECKKEGVKILKGELRQGVTVVIKENTSLKYRHWGCVTPTVLANWKEKSEGDPELIDGLDELPQDAQDKVMRAIEQGHVDDEDWRGDPQMNRPGMGSGMHMTKKIKKQLGIEDDDDDDAEKKKPAKKRGRKEADGDDDDDEAEAKPAKKARGKKATTADDADEEAEEKPAKKSKAKKSKAKNEDVDEPEDEPAPAAKKAAKSKKAKPAPKADDSDDEPIAPAKTAPKKRAAKKDASQAKPQKRGKAKKAAVEDAEEE
ncbi:Zinc finger PARP-type [Lecanosticta acicola]|uniref:Zinc finger PARP-type n=1 Tax=Lecanosticta acicola TaxID=111012 RepID=A0AAI9E944_9PEZI|nr:Zinc finger PARP-type [Lecanosticta acicola]